MTANADNDFSNSRRKDPPVIDLKGGVSLRQTSVRGGIAKLVSQVINFVVRLLFIAILSRFIEPEDFGLFTMAIVFVGVFEVIATGGFSQAAVQHQNVSEEQLSSLFLCNTIFSAMIAVACYASSFWIFYFYHEARISAVIVALIPGFVLTSVGAVHITLLQRQMRFVELACIDVFSGLLSSSLGIALAMAGHGYWALVAAAVTWPATNSVGAWIVSGWVPRWSRQIVGVAPMIKLGLTAIANNLVVYFAYNSEKMFLGRFWGAEALGLYGRASQLCAIPGAQLNQAVGPIAFSALARMQGDPRRLRKYFLNFYYLSNCVTAPLALFFLFFSPEVIALVLGPRWVHAQTSFRLLAPGILILGMMNPPGWLLFALGLQKRSLAIAAVIAPLCILAYAAGLPYGPSGVSAAYSTALAVWLIPHLIWCFHGTPVTLKDALLVVAPSFLAGLVGALTALCVLSSVSVAAPVLRFAIAAATMGAVHLLVFLFVLGQKHKVLDLWKDVRASI